MNRGFWYYRFISIYQFINVVQKLLPRILFRKFKPVNFIIFAFPKIAYHARPFFLFDDDIHHLVLNWLQFQILLPDFESNIWLCVNLWFLLAEKHVNEAVDCNDQVAIFILLTGLGCRNVLDLELLQQDDPAIEWFKLKPALWLSYLFTYLVKWSIVSYSVSFIFCRDLNKLEVLSSNISSKQ